MKVAVITRHAITNYGSLLQALATQQVIENLGHSCEIIDYIRDNESYQKHEKTLLARKPEWNNNPLRKAVYLALRQPESIAAGKRFEKERSEYLHLTKRYSSLSELKVSKPIADVYLTGSDQVWGPTEDGSYDSSYCLSFTGESDKCVSYAASFGRSEMNDRVKNFFSKWLRRYTHISVREDSAVRLLNDLGIHADQVIDPTLLLDSDYWNQFIQPIGYKKYVLVYQIHNDKNVGKYAKAVAKQMNLPLLRVSASFHQISREGKLIWCPDVNTFLSYIKNAECLITDSFHGTAFAINMNTPFVEILPKNNTGTRNLGILNLVGLSDRVLTNLDDITLAFKPIDYERVNAVLKEKREYSLTILKKIIEN